MSTFASGLASGWSSSAAAGGGFFFLLFGGGVFSCRRLLGTSDVVVSDVSARLNSTFNSTASSFAAVSATGSGTSSTTTRSVSSPQRLSLRGSLRRELALNLRERFVRLAFLLAVAFVVVSSASARRSPPQSPAACRR